ncbi:MAG: hypothetical protein CL694_08170 [Chloroflexi bacterium]|nr:hypothetical protein [Chloroflexota bacterium]
MGVVVVGVVAYVNPFEDEEELVAKPPWFYQVSFDDINTIKITSGDNVESFHMNEEGIWVFDNLDGIPPDHNRWGGIVLLVSGPKTKRDISEVRTIIEDPAEYGLDFPKLIVDVGLTAGRSIEFRLGADTPEGDFNYGQVSGFTQLFLIADSWGEVLARIANDPPIPEWFVTRTPESIEEVNLYMGDPAAAGNQYLTLQQEDGKWFGRSRPEDVKPRQLDPDKFAKYSHLMVGPQNILVETARVSGDDYSEWGIELEGQSIEIRFLGVTERGTSFTDGVLFQLGDKTPDGNYYFAAPASDQFTTPVLRLEAEWTEAMFDLFENVPFSDEDASAGSG